MKLLLLDRPLDESIIENREVEFFGPWAQPIQSPEDLARPVFEPYPTPESVQRTSLEAITVARDLLKQLAEIMPEITGVNRGERFWRLLLGHHVVVLAGIVQDVATRHRALPEKDYILGLDSGCNLMNSVPHSWEDAQERIFCDDCFRRYAVALYLQNQYKGYEYIEYLKVPRERIADKNRALLRRIRRYGFRRLLKNALPISPAGSNLWGWDRKRWNDARSLVWDRYQLGDFNFRQVGAIVLPEKLLPGTKLLPPLSADGEKRDKLKNSLPQPCGELLSLSLPLIVIEGLSHLVDLVSEMLPRLRNIERIYTHGQGFVDEGPKRTLLALLADEGKRIISVQHGGGATYLAHSWDFLERAVADAYISWGKGYLHSARLTGDDNEVKALPSLYLTRLRRTGPVGRKRKWDILFVVLEENRYVKWLYCPLFPDMSHDYFTREKVLFDYLGKIGQVAVKVYPETYGWGQAEWIRKKYPQAEVLAGGRFVDYASQSGIVIIDYSSTAFLEMLAMGRPFLATWNRRWFRGNSRFEQFIDRLVEVGIFYEQPEALVQSYAETISPDVAFWWNNEKRQEIVKEMASNFALTSDSAYEEWSEEFRRD